MNRHIVQELQKENAASEQRCKALEAENKILLSETEQLREVRLPIQSRPITLAHFVRDIRI